MKPRATGAPARGEDDAAAATPAEGPKEPAPLPFRMPCGDKDLVGCTNGCNDKQTEDCVTLASMLLSGEVVSIDKERAIPLLRAACDESSARGCMRLGDIYRSGVLQGPAEETACYRKACDGGANNGCIEAGKAYLSGRGVEADAKISAALFLKVCDRGNALGCFELGRLYEIGEGVKKDSERSFKLYTKACHLGLDQGCIAASRTEEVIPPRN